MNKGEICVSICGSTAGDVLNKIGRATDHADLVEIRFDCVAPDQMRPLADELAISGKRLLLTFRPADQGGTRQLTLTERLKFWEFVLSRFEGTDFLIDYEFDMDFPLQLDRERAIVSMHDFEGVSRDLQRVAAMSVISDRTIKIAVAVEDVTDAIEVWKLLENTSQRVIPIAMGEAGKWTRVLGLAHGAPMTYASIDDAGKTAPGQISASDLRDVFRVKELDKDTKVFGLIAADTSYSLSPFMHNRAFKTVGMNAVFLPLQTKDLDAFMRRMVMPETREVELNFKGFSVTNPHKQAIMRHLDEIDETASKIGAVNTVKINDGKLLGYNTDAPGFIRPLKNLYGDLKDARAIVVGAGGAARACIYALKSEGVDVTVMARDVVKANRLAQEFKISAASLTDNMQLETDILVNATPLGTRGDREGDAIATTDELGSTELVYDLVYNPAETRLLRNAREAGAKTLGGIEMLIAQGTRQFEIWTGGEAPGEVMKLTIEERLI